MEKINEVIDASITGYGKGLEELYKNTSPLKFYAGNVGDSVYYSVYRRYLIIKSYYTEVAIMLLIILAVEELTIGGQFVEFYCPIIALVTSLLFGLSYIVSKILRKHFPAISDEIESMSLESIYKFMISCRFPNQLELDVLMKGVTHNSWSCTLAGSSTDGFGFLPFFKSSSIFTTGLLWQDIDLNIFHKRIFLNNCNAIFGCCPGFFFICLDPTDVSGTFLEKCPLPKNSKMLLSGKETTKLIGEYIEGEKQYNFPAVTCVRTCSVKMRKSNVLMDVVFGIRLLSSTEILKSWFHRVSTFLPEHICDVIKGKCYFVHKQCPIIKSDNTDFLWRISFAEVERILFKYHNKKKSLMFCYVLIKCSLRQWSRTKQFKMLKSYYLKTLILWLAENPPNSKSFDIYEFRNNEQICRFLVYILKEYETVIKSGVLRHYFLPEINIFSAVTESERINVLPLIEDFYSAPFELIER